MTESFSEDNNIQRVAEVYAADAVEFARKHFNLSLDWSDGSVVHIETMLGIYHDHVTKAKPSDEQIFSFAKMFGSYVGEVFRRNHGATWGLVNLGGQTFPGLRANGAAGLFWPWGRAQNRITNGSEDNVWHYYQFLLQRNGSSSTPNPSAPSASSVPEAPAAPTAAAAPTAPVEKKKSWWERLRGA